MIKVLFSNVDWISTIISLFAFISSCIALYETKKQHTDSYRSKIIFNIIQQDHKLYLIVQNIGQTSAFDVEVSFNHDIDNPVRNLHVISPNTIYRYHLMESAQVSSYPELKVLQISVKYRDIYCKSAFWLENSAFPILELLKYTCNWNERQNCFDIRRI